MVLPLPWCKTQHLFLNIKRLPFTQPSSLSRSHWMPVQPSTVSATPPSVFHHQQTCWRVLSISSSRSLMKNLNMTGPSTQLEGKLPVAGLPVRFCIIDHNPLSSAIQPVLSSLTVYSSSLHFLKLCIRPTWEKVSKPCWSWGRQTTLTAFPSCIYPAGHAIKEVYEISEQWFPLCESMLPTPDNLLFLNMLRDGP